MRYLRLQQPKCGRSHCNKRHLSFCNLIELAIYVCRGL